MSKDRSRLLGLFLALALVFVVSAPSAQKTTTHSGILRFLSLDGSSEDLDGVVNGVWTVPHGVVLEGRLVCDDGETVAGCNMALRVQGDLVLRPGSGIAAGEGLRVDVEGDLRVGEGAFLVSERGPIELSARGQIEIDGLVSANGASRARGANGVLGGVAAGHRRSSAAVVLKSTGGPGMGIRVGPSGTVLSAGGSKAGNRVELSGCGLEILGLVASVENGSGAGVVMRSCEGLIIDGRDLEDPNGLRWGKIEVQGSGIGQIDLLARESVVLDGAELRVAGVAANGNRIAVTSDQGSLSWRHGLGETDSGGAILLTACDGIELGGSRIAPQPEIVEACAGVRKSDPGLGLASLSSSL